MESAKTLRMPRVAKAVHVLAKLRSELGGLYQREFAERVGLSRRTIQNIERGVSELSRRNAIKISEGTGVSVKWLIENDWKKPIQNAFGKRWTAKDLPARLNPLSQLQPEIRRYRLASRAVLVDQYLQMCRVIEGLDNPIEAIIAWDRCFSDALYAFINEYQPLAEDSPKLFAPAPDQREQLEYVLGYPGTLIYRHGPLTDELKLIQDDIEALKWAYKHPTSEDPDPLTTYFWGEVAAGRPLSDVLEEVAQRAKLRVPEKEKTGEIAWLYG